MKLRYFFAIGSYGECTDNLFRFIYRFVKVYTKKMGSIRIKIYKEGI